jgi:hypothetical protein
MERHDIKLDLMKANIVVKKRKEDLVILLVDTSGMDDDVKACCAVQRTTILAGSQALPAPQPNTTTPATATTPPATELSHRLPYRHRRSLRRRRPPSSPIPLWRKLLDSRGYLMPTGLHAPFLFLVR